MNNLRIVTYNLLNPYFVKPHHESAKQMFDSGNITRRLRNIKIAIETCNPDIMLIQEINEEGFRTLNAYFKNYSGIHSLGTNYSEKNGNAIFWEKKYDMKERDAIKRTIGRDVIVDLSVEGDPYRVICVHLYGSPDRTRGNKQLNELIEKSENITTKYKINGIIIGGDFNAEYGRNPEDKRLTTMTKKGYFTPAEHDLKFASQHSDIYGKKLIDYIFFKNLVRHSSIRISGIIPEIPDEIIRKASDHMPICVIFKVNYTTERETSHWGERETGHREILHQKTYLKYHPEEREYETRQTRRAIDPHQEKPHQEKPHRGKSRYSLGDPGYDPRLDRGSTDFNPYALLRYRKGKSDALMRQHGKDYNPNLDRHSSLRPASSRITSHREKHRSDEDSKEHVSSGLAKHHLSS